MKTPFFAVVAALVLLPTLLLAQSPYTTNGSTLFLYHFDEGASSSTAADASGHGRTANYGSGSITGVPGQSGMGNAFTVAGGGANPEWVDSANPNGQNSPLYQLAANSFTVEMWIRFDDLAATSNSYLFTIHPSDQVLAADFSLSIIPQANLTFGGALSVGDSRGVDQIITPKIAWVSGEWYHIAVTYEAKGGGVGDYRFYVNRAGDDAEPMPFHQVLNRAQLQMMGGNTNPRVLDIGNIGGGYGSTRFRGTMDEFRISNTALTQFSTLQPVPEPTSMLLGSIAGVVFLFRLRRHAREA